MEYKKLLEYIGTVANLEKNKYIQEQTIACLQQTLNSYENEYNANNSFVDAPYIPPEKIEVNKFDKWIMVIMVYICGSVGASFGGVIGGITGHLLDNSLISGVVGVLVGIIGAVIGGCIPYFIWKRKKSAQASILTVRGKRIHEEEVSARESRNLQLMVNIPEIEKALDAMKKTYNSTCNTLARYYGLNHIKEDYRGLVPVCTIYQYLLDERTHSLARVGGDPGAYNMYKEDLKARLIFHELAQIRNGISDLREGQRELGRIIQEGNATTQMLLREINGGIDKTIHNQEIHTYQNNQMIQNQKSMENLIRYGY